MKMKSKYIYLFVSFTVGFVLSLLAMTFEDYIHNIPINTEVHSLSHYLTTLILGLFSAFIGYLYWKIRTQQIEAYNALAENKLMYKTAFITSPDSININTLDGIYVDINEGFTRLTNYTREDVIGKYSSDIKIWKIPADREKLVKGLKETGVVENLESTFVCKDGSTKIALMSASIIKIKNSPHILSVTRDISDRIIMEKELIAAKEKAEENDKLKSSFLNNISHEVRTPMNSIIGFSQLLATENDSIEKRKYYSTLIHNGCNQLLDVITNVIEISQIQSNQVRVLESEVNIENIFTELEEIFEPKCIEKNLNITLQIQTNENQNSILTDHYKLTKIFYLLIDNAIKFTKSGGITIGCKLIEHKYYEFTIADTGIGIDPAMHSKIFEPFYQVEKGMSRNYGGNGIGLSIAKAFVELLGGQIQLKSELNLGSVFSFTLPYLPVPTKEVTQPS